MRTPGDPGTYDHDNAAATPCEACAPRGGHFGAIGGGTVCDPCSPGTYNEDARRLACDLCSGGQCAPRLVPINVNDNVRRLNLEMSERIEACSVFQMACSMSKQLLCEHSELE